jgi:hypothetical protein
MRQIRAHGSACRCEITKNPLYDTLPFQFDVKVKHVSRGAQDSKRTFCTPCVCLHCLRANSTPCPAYVTKSNQAACASRHRKNMHTRVSASNKQFEKNLPLQSLMPFATADCASSTSSKVVPGSHCTAATMNAPCKASWPADWLRACRTRSYAE